MTLNVSESDNRADKVDTNDKNTRAGQKTIPISARISHDDAEFISTLKIQGVTTPSEKVRVLISEARKRYEGIHDYRSSLLMYQDMLNRVVAETREIENEHHIHSELVSRLLDWLPDMMAFVTSMGMELQTTKSIEKLKALEEGMTDRSFRLVNAVLQMGITDECPCYQTDSVSKRMSGIINLVNVIQK